MTIEQALESISPEPNSGCWLWLGAIGNNGYGNITLKKGKAVLAHRAIYEHHKGPILAGLHIDHKCKVKCCVNPDHLEPVTHRENMRRVYATHCRKGHSSENFMMDGKYKRCSICRKEWERATYGERKEHKNAVRRALYARKRATA